MTQLDCHKKVGQRFLQQPCVAGFVAFDNGTSHISLTIYLLPQRFCAKSHQAAK